MDDKALTWLRNYHGSRDSTALLLAYRAGRREALAEAAHEVDGVRELNGSNWNEEALRTLDVAVMRIQRLNDPQPVG